MGMRLERVKLETSHNLRVHTVVYARTLLHTPSLLCGSSALAHCVHAYPSFFSANCLLTVLAPSGSVRDHFARTELGIERRSATRAAVVVAEAFCERLSSVRYLLLVLVIHIPTRATEHPARWCRGTRTEARDALAEDMLAAFA
jgi:hypothetical protein